MGGGEGGSNQNEKEGADDDDDADSDDDYDHDNEEERQYFDVVDEGLYRCVFRHEGYEAGLRAKRRRTTGFFFSLRNLTT